MKGTIQFITTVEIDGDNREEIERAYIDFAKQLRHWITPGSKVRLPKEPWVVDSTGYSEYSAVPGGKFIEYSEQKLKVNDWNFYYYFVYEHIITQDEYGRNASAGHLNDSGGFSIIWQGTSDEANTFAEKLKCAYPHLIRDHSFETDDDGYSVLTLDFS